ncbi:VIN3-like protein 2 [Linum perenne]
MDFSNYWKLSMTEKTKLVYELSDHPDASELLQTWSRQDILQILCSEMGKERKYTGLTKLKIIEQLLRIVDDKKSSAGGGETESSSSPFSKRQRKMDDVPTLTPTTPSIPSSTVYCKNSACKATMKQDDAFCKRCSCCICCKYDDNKDPSLWMTCSEDPPFQGPACGMSCHLDCALKHEATGIGEDNGGPGKLDGSFRCVGCGKVNDLLVFLRKQLMIAKETRRVDILCYRLSVSWKLLNGTVKYQQLLKIVDEAIKQLEIEVGPITGLPVKMGRGIVNRLSVGPAIQNQCASVLESLDNIMSTHVCPPPPLDSAAKGTHYYFLCTSKSKKRSADRVGEQCTANGNPDEELECCVKMIRWLECQGHIEKKFRQKFLTWYSLRASAEEMRVVKAYVDTFIEDPSALAEQLVDTFSECISSGRRSSVVPAGFCMKLWH